MYNLIYKIRNIYSFSISYLTSFGIIFISPDTSILFSLYRWTQGYDGQELFYIDQDVICYQCGRNVKIVQENGVQTVFAFHGNGLGPFTVHKLNKKFAIAERCINPTIFVYNYPSLQEHVVLQGHYFHIGISQLCKFTVLFLI